MNAARESEVSEVRRVYDRTYRFRIPKQPLLEIQGRQGTGGHGTLQDLQHIRERTTVFAATVVVPAYDSLNLHITDIRDQLLKDSLRERGSWGTVDNI